MSSGKYRLMTAAALAATFGLTVPTLSLSYQAMMRKAEKYGGEDCLFCHVYEDGGQGWNERGLWLIKERDRRKAEKIDVDWLADYVPDDNESAAANESKKEKSKP